MKNGTARRRNQYTILCVVGLTLGCSVRAQSAAREPAKPAARAKVARYLAPTRENYRKLGNDVEATLRRDVLNAWFPRTVDRKHGGFRADFTREWKPGARSGGKFSVFQGRMTWIAAQAAMRRPELKERFLPIARHGLQYLSDTLWDKQYGGFYWGLDDHAQVNSFYTDGKHLYGNSFALYGTAAAYQATGDPKALELAQKAFRWIDEHAHDAKNGGYFEWLTREGRVVEGNPDAAVLQPVPVAFFPVGYKSMNTHIHLLESFTQLYEVWKDEAVRQRLEELLAIVRDRICVEPGVMNLYFNSDWRAIPGHDSYGHDVETAYLMLEAEEVLGRGHDPKTERMARMLVDHALANGWDNTLGGFYQEGTTFGKAESRLKEWWVQMEGLNALLLMHEKYGWQTDVYFKAFQKQWRFIKRYQIDSQFHGVYEMVGPSGNPVKANKGHIWKAAYHDGRALLNVSERLRRMASGAQVAAPSDYVP
jgi:mannobiose 2-epimerase